MERYFVEHCAPTLASIKCANLFSYTFADQQEFETILSQWNRQFQPKGIQLQVLRVRENKALVYMFRPRKIELLMQDREIADFLASYGYTDLSPQAVVNRLATRIQTADSFPHEVGIMLGYPLDDVKSFIVNEGKNYRLTGLWKVYHNENEAVKIFEKFKKCRDVYTSLYDGGRTIMQMTVVA